MSELFEKEKPKRPECCPKCGSVNINFGKIDMGGATCNGYKCMDCWYVFNTTNVQKEIK